MFDSLREKECGCACVRERLCVGVHACVHACVCVCVCGGVCMHTMRVCIYGYAVNQQHLFSC